MWHKFRDTPMNLGIVFNQNRTTRFTGVSLVQIDLVFTQDEI